MKKEWKGNSEEEKKRERVRDKKLTTDYPRKREDDKVEKQEREKDRRRNRE